MIDPVGPYDLDRGDHGLAPHPRSAGQSSLPWCFGHACLGRLSLQHLCHVSVLSFEEKRQGVLTPDGLLQ
jgi:hypothetical protein